MNTRWKCASESLSVILCDLEDRTKKKHLSYQVGRSIISMISMNMKEPLLYIELALRSPWPCFMN